MNLTHTTPEYWPFEELWCRLYIKYHVERIRAQHQQRKVNIMAVIISVSSTILALAIWQDYQNKHADS
jgi:hypothetical protein